MSLQQFGDEFTKVLENTPVEVKDRFISNVLLIIQNATYSDEERVKEILESFNEYFHIKLGE